MAERVSPVWVWLPGQVEPVLAARLHTGGGGARWHYEAAYLRRPDAVACDPETLRLPRASTSPVPRPIHVLESGGLPGVVFDAAPQGWGADRLQARAGRELGTLDLLEEGPADTVGALEVCEDIERKLAWKPLPMESVRESLRLLDDDAPASRAVRHALGDASTSAGGERPKVTVEHEGSLYLAKVQARVDTPYLPHKEMVTMSLAGESQITIPRLHLDVVGSNAVFLIERFDRRGDPQRPQRRLFASAHTVLRLDRASVSGDPKRSYLHLADRMRTWCRGGAHLGSDLAELWRRMAFNALVGNMDDHPRNHGLIHDGTTWRLSPAFDITPARQYAGALSMNTGPDGRATVTVARMIECCAHFGVTAEEAGAWLMETANRVVAGFEMRLTALGVPKEEIAQTLPATSFAQEVVHRPDAVEVAMEASQKRSRRRRPASAIRR